MYSNSQMNISSFKVAAFYSFIKLTNLKELQEIFFEFLQAKDIKGTVPGVNEGNLHNKMDTFKSKAVKRRDEKSFGTIASATKRYELLKKIIGSKKKHDKPAIKK